jgi:DnaJ-class molecular chaperone
MLPITDILGRTYDLTIPPRTNPGATMRLRGRGVEREGHNTGDLFVRLKATMPTDINEEILNVIQKHQVNK